MKGVQGKSNKQKACGEKKGKGSVLCIAGVGRLRRAKGIHAAQQIFINFTKESYQAIPNNIVSVLFFSP